MTRRYFGTDGIRGRVGEYPISADFMLKLGWAAGRVLAGAERRSVVIGKDTRISGYMFESALEAGLSAAGADIRLLGPMPTPAIAYLTRTLKACAGIVISASHNPFDDNGIKFFSGSGEKLPDEVEDAIEVMLEQPFVSVAPDRLGKAQRIDDAPGRYIEFCKSCFPRELNLDGLKLVLDCANGATYHVAPRVFAELGARVEAIGVAPDGLNINRDSGSTQPDALVRRVRESGADAGMAFDGDGDRVIFVDHNGRLIDGDGVLYVIARHAKRAGRLGGGVVGTVMTNLGLENALRDLGIEFKRVQVGDRYVHQALAETGWQLGGETSGHVLCRDLSTAGDGIVTALKVLTVMVETGDPLAELVAGLDIYPQRMINVPTNGRAFEAGDVHIGAAVTSAEKELGDSGRVILRPSGTEPLVRVTVEGRESAQVDRVAQQLARAVSESLQAS